MCCLPLLTSPLFPAVLPFSFLPCYLTASYSVSVCLSVLPPLAPLHSTHWHWLSHICRHFKHAPFQRDPWKREALNKSSNKLRFYFYPACPGPCTALFYFVLCTNIFIPLSLSFSSYPSLVSHQFFFQFTLFPSLPFLTISLIQPLLAFHPSIQNICNNCFNSVCITVFPFLCSTRKILVQRGFPLKFSSPSFNSQLEWRDHLSHRTLGRQLRDAKWRLHIYI